MGNSNDKDEDIDEEEQEPFMKKYKILNRINDAKVGNC